jgi:putative transposase
MDRLLDQACTGPLHLRRPDIAQLVVDAIHYRQQHLQHFQLHSYAVMLITPLVQVSKAMHSLKRFTAREANRILTLSGPFWPDESYDHLVRDEAEFRRIVNYIELNPVKAGLVTTPEAFLWSSARTMGPIDSRPVH